MDTVDIINTQNKDRLHNLNLKIEVKINDY